MKSLWVKLLNFLQNTRVLADSVADLLTGNDKLIYDSLSKVNASNQLIIAQQLAKEKADSDSLDLVAKTGPLFSKFTFTQQNTGPKVGYAKGLDTASVSLMLNDPVMSSLVPSNVSFLWTSEEEDQGGDVSGIFINCCSNRRRLCNYG